MEFVENLKNKMIGPLQEKIDALSEGFERIVNLIMKFPLTYDNKLDDLSRRISILEQKLSRYESQVNNLKANSHTQLQPKPPPPNPSEINKTENQRIENKPPVRQEIINELKRIFELRNGKNKDSENKGSES